MITFPIRGRSLRDRRFGMFTPKQLVGLQIWIDASREKGFANDDPVGSATDWSGFGRSMTSSSGARPLFKTTGGPGGMPSFLHDGTDDVLTATNFATGFIAGEVFIVLKRTTTANKGIWTWSNSSGNGGYYPFGGAAYAVFGTDERKDAITSLVTFTDWHLLNETSAPSNWHMFQNGKEAHATATNTVNFSPDGLPEIAIGRSRNGENFADMSWSELLMWNRVLSANERAMVNNYIARKWALAI